MKINSSITNYANNSAILSNGHKKEEIKSRISSPKDVAPLNFTGGNPRNFLNKAFDATKGFFKRNVAHGIDINYANQGEVFEALNKNFGSTFEKCVSDIDAYNNLIKKGRNVLSYTIEGNSITFHKTPFVQNLAEGVKEFTLGTVLDIGVAARKGISKLSKHAGEISGGAESVNKNIVNRILDKRIAEKRAKDAFYRLSGAFEKAYEGIDSSDVDKISKNIQELAGNSIKSASKKVGKYNTKAERAWNRLGTGFVSATFAATDFYNISMLQNNDKEKANASGHKRFKQDMRRQGLTAGITYVVLGAFQNKVNKSMLYAVLSLGGVTLISEILSRVMGKIPLTPLSPEKAKEIAEKKEAKKAQKGKEENKPLKQENKIAPSLSQGMMNFLINASSKTSSNKLAPDKKIFNIFGNKPEEKKDSPSFTSNPDNTEPKKKKSVLGTVGKVILGGVGLSLGIGFLRTKNVFHINDLIKTVSKGYNGAVKKMTRRQSILPKEQVDGFMNYLNDNGFAKQKDKLAPFMKTIREKNPDGLYYNMGELESKWKSAGLKVVLYPINAVTRLLSSGNTLVKKILTKEPAKKASMKLDSETAISFIENYSKKFQKARDKGDLSAFQEELQTAFTRHFSEANSKNKNTTIAMLSRLLITFISGYFFVNDYRNEVLIESKGEDVERANATARERVGHKVSNFFLNSMFMDLFNTTFEPIYLSSVVGATAVAMATEFTNESAVRASICTPKKKMDRDGLIEYENKRLNDKGIKGKYYRAFMKLTGKKPLSLKANKSKKG